MQKLFPLNIAQIVKSVKSFQKRTGPVQSFTEFALLSVIVF